MKRALPNFVFAVSVGLTRAHMNVRVGHIKKALVSFNTAIRRQHIELYDHNIVRGLSRTQCE